VRKKENRKYKKNETEQMKEQRGNNDERQTKIKDRE
jgi:hypothetical protein